MNLINHSHRAGLESSNAPLRAKTFGYFLFHLRKPLLTSFHFPNSHWRLFSIRWLVWWCRRIFGIQAPSVFENTRPVSSKWTAFATRCQIHYFPRLPRLLWLLGYLQPVDFAPSRGIDLHWSYPLEGRMRNNLRVLVKMKIAMLLERSKIIKSLKK